MLTLTLYPYVYMLARVAFETAGARTLEAAQSLGLDRRAAFRRLLLPMARPAIAAGVALACMETLADFGVVSALNVDTYTTSIYRAWYGMFSVAAALQMAAVLGLFAIAGVWLERRLRGNRGFAANRASSDVLPRQELNGAAAVAAFLAAATVLALALRAADAAVARVGAEARGHRPRCPVLGLRRPQRVAGGIGSGRGGHVSADPGVRVARRIPSLAARRWAAWRTWDTPSRGRCSPSACSLPSPPLNGWLQDWLDAGWGAQAPQLFLQGTLLTMLVAYLARFLAVGTGPVESGLARIHRNLDEAAENLGVRGLGPAAASPPAPAAQQPGGRVGARVRGPHERIADHPDDASVRLRNPRGARVRDGVRG